MGELDSRLGTKVKGDSSNAALSLSSHWRESLCVIRRACAATFGFVALLLARTGCVTESAVDPVLEELKSYTILFSRFTTKPPLPDLPELTTFTMRGDGSALVDLSKHSENIYPKPPGYDNFPKFSPSGAYIAYQTTSYGTYEIFRMNSDGTGKVNLTNYPDFDLDFEWSPSGQEIVFTRLMEGQYEIFKMKNDGSGQQNLTNNPASDRYPSWSPDGSKIAFSRLVSQSPNRWQVFIMNADGSSQVAFTDTSESALFPHWSRDGNRIYYDIPGVGMVVRSLDGSFTRRLDGIFSRYMSWSPDGKSFVTSGLYIVDTDLTNARAAYKPGSEPSWSPDGKWIVFRRADESGRGDLYVVRPDGTELRRLTTSQYGDLNPSWKPAR